MCEVPQLRGDAAERRSHRLGRRCVCVCVCVCLCVCVSVCVCVWWTFGLVFIISPGSRPAPRLSALKSSRLIQIFTHMCNTQNTCLLSFHLSSPPPHTLADFLLLETVFNHVIVGWKYYLRKVDYFKFPRQEAERGVLQLAAEGKYRQVNVFSEM